MKKKILLVVLSIAFILGIALTIVNIDLDAKVEKGHRLYDQQTGEVNGCQSPGTDCTYIY